VTKQQQLFEKGKKRLLQEDDTKHLPPFVKLEEE